MSLVDQSYPHILLQTSERIFLKCHSLEKSMSRFIHRWPFEVGATKSGILGMENKLGLKKIKDRENKQKKKNSKYGPKNKQVCSVQE